MGPTFLDFLHQFTSRTLIIDWKKIHFRFFSLKKDISTTYVTTTLVDFMVFWHLHSKTRLLPAFFIFSWCLENIKNRPSLCSTRLGCARSRFSWVYHDHCDQSGENVIFVIKKTKKCFFLVSKGCFWCKMRGGIQKSWSRCSTTLTFCEIGTFLKKMIFATNLS